MDFALSKPALKAGVSMPKKLLESIWGLAFKNIRKHSGETLHDEAIEEVIGKINNILNDFSIEYEDADRILHFLVRNIDPKPGTKDVSSDLLYFSNELKKRFGSDVELELTFSELFGDSNAIEIDLRKNTYQPDDSEALSEFYGSLADTIKNQDYQIYVLTDLQPPKWPTHTKPSTAPQKN